MIEFMFPYNAFMPPMYDIPSSNTPEQAVKAGCLSFLAGFVGILLGLLLCCLLSGCKSVEYVPVETVRTEIVHQTDTVEKKIETNKETNTIIRESRPEDSVMLAKLGIKLAANERLIILQQQQISDLTNELKEKHSNDTVRTEKVEVPVPVERKLSRWEQFCLDYGKVTTGITIAVIMAFVLFIIKWLRRKSGK